MFFIVRAESCTRCLTKRLTIGTRFRAEFGGAEKTGRELRIVISRLFLRRRLARHRENWKRDIGKSGIRCRLTARTLPSRFHKSLPQQALPRNCAFTWDRKTTTF